MITRKLETALAVLNGAIGDYLVKAENPLATDMTLAHRGVTYRATRDELAKVHPAPTGKVAIFVHGLMCSESIWERADGTCIGTDLARDLGFTPLYVRYNTGRPIADNGAAFASLVSDLVAAWPVPVEEIMLVGYSMGGLVVRSACHVAATAVTAHAAHAAHGAWLGLVKRAFYVGSPHLGAPAERLGRALVGLLRSVPDPYVQLAVDLGELRSDGLKDLGDADLRHEDRARRTGSWSLRDERHPVPLLPSIQHFLAAGTLSEDPLLARLFGDSIVPLPSATDGACTSSETMALPPSHVKIFPRVAHIDLARHPGVYESLRDFCMEIPS